MLFYIFVLFFTSLNYLHIYLLTYLPTPWNWVLEKLAGFQLVNNSPGFFGSRRFVTAFTRDRHLFLSDQINPVHGPPFYFLKINLNITLPSTPGSSKWCLSLGFPHKKSVYAFHLPHTCYMPQPITLFTFTRILFGEEYKSVSSSLCSFLHYPVISSLLGPNILLSTLFFKNPQPTFFPQCGRPSLTPVKTTNKIIFPCILIFIYMDSKLEDKRFCTESVTTTCF